MPHRLRQDVLDATREAITATLKSLKNAPVTSNTADRRVDFLSSEIALLAMKKPSEG